MFVNTNSKAITLFTIGLAICMIPTLQRMMASTSKRLPVLDPRTFPRPPLLEKANRHLQIKYGEEIIADTKDAYWVLETYHPPSKHLFTNSVVSCWAFGHRSIRVVPVASGRCELLASVQVSFVFERATCAARFYQDDLVVSVKSRLVIFLSLPDCDALTNWKISHLCRLILYTSLHDLSCF